MVRSPAKHTAPSKGTATPRRKAPPAPTADAQHAVVSEPVRVFRALGHPSRLRITETLAAGEACVDALRELLGCSWSTVSQHLSVLRQAGVVSSTRDGNRIVYRLALPCVATFTSCLIAATRGQRVELRTCCN